MQALGGTLPTVKIPPSCKACGQCDLLPANQEPWSLYCQYQSLISNGMAGWQVDYQAAFTLFDRLYLSDAPRLIRSLEAIKTGFASAKRMK